MPANGEWNRRWSGRYQWCHQFVVGELYDYKEAGDKEGEGYLWQFILKTVDDECRYIARRCRHRLIDRVAAHNRMPRGEYMARVQRDSKGRFLKTYADPAPQYIAAGKVLYSKGKGAGAK